MLDQVQKNLDKAEKEVLELKTKNGTLIEKLKSEKKENGDELDVEHIISGIVELTKEERKEFSKLIRTTGEGRRVYSIIIYGN